MLIKKIQDERTQIALLRLQREGMRRALDPDQFVFHAEFFQHAVEFFALVRGNGFIRRAVND